MSGSYEVFDRDALEELEQQYRLLLKESPDDINCRINLAWCLFVEAVHRAGQESLLRALQESGELSADLADNRTQAALDGNAYRLLKACLQQTFTVQQMSPHSLECQEVRRLQALVRQCGGEEAVFEAESETERTLLSLVQAIMKKPREFAKDSLP